MAMIVFICMFHSVSTDLKQEAQTIDKSILSFGIGRQDHGDI